MSSISEACQDDIGFIPPIVPPPQSGIHWEYHPEIVSLRTTLPSLAAFPTTSWLPLSKIELIIDDVHGWGGPAAQEWELLAGAADPTDPGQVAPNDFDAVNNNKYWSQVT